MIDFILDNPIRFIVALVIGLLTAWWIWGRLGSMVAETADKAGNMAKSTADSVGDVAKGTAGAVGDVALSAVDTATGAAGAVAGGTTAVGAGAIATASSAKDTVGEMLEKPKIAAAVGDPDDLTVIKGIGPKLNDLCHSLGVMRFDQISQWNTADVAEVDQYLKIKGRIDRDRWVDQAKLLAAGDEAAHKDQFLN